MTRTPVGGPAFDAVLRAIRLVETIGLPAPADEPRPPDFASQVVARDLAEAAPEDVIAGLVFLSAHLAADVGREVGTDAAGVLEQLRRIFLSVATDEPPPDGAA